MLKGYIETKIESNEVNEPQLLIDYVPAKKVSTSNDISTPKDTLNVLSLFSGCGGMDLGFEGAFMTMAASISPKSHTDFVERDIDGQFVLLKKTKFKTVFANDILEDAKNAWLTHFSKRNPETGIFHSDSIVDLVKMHRNGTNIFPSGIDVVTGGFPCQDFSVAGKRKGFNSHKNHKGEIIKIETASTETRGQLYMWMKEVIEITQPKIFIAENVKGLVNLENVKDIIQHDFSTAGDNGYIVLSPQVLHAADYGIPQSRERVIFIGIKKSALKKAALEALQQDTISPKYNPYPKPTHGYTQKGNGLAQVVTAKEVFKLLKSEPEETNDLSHKHYSKAKYMGAHCQGQTEVKMDGLAPTIRAEHHGNIEFRRLSHQNGGKLANELAQGLKERRLTPRECALIQTFPPDYDFVIESKSGRKGSFLVSTSQAYKIIGNAVPPLLAYHVAKRLEKVWPLYFNERS